MKYRLEKLAEKQNFPKSGYIFQNPKKPNTHLATNQVVSAWRLAAKDLGWPSEDLPRGHSGRNSMVPILMKMGISDQKINVYLRWTHGSSMISHYQGTSLECSDQGSAFLLQKAIEDGSIENLTNDIL